MTIVKPEPSAEDRILAAIDVGSNSIKMTVARRTTKTGAGLDEFLWRSETVRLGQGIDQTGELAADRVAAALDTLTRFAAEAREAGATRLIAVATEATRLARNGDAFLEQVTELTGIEIQAISGDREASLTFLGLQGIVDLGGRLAVADIGGGSTEIIIAIDGRISWSRSLPLGSGRLTDRNVRSDPPARVELDVCRSESHPVIAIAPLADVAGGRLIIVGGTGEYLARLIPDGAGHTTETLDSVLDRLTGIRAAELSAMIAIPEARARVLPAGVAIACAIADQMTPAMFETAQSGIRRGLLLAAFAGEI